MDWDEIPVAVVHLDKTMQDFDGYGFVEDMSDDTYFGEELI